MAVRVFATKDGGMTRITAAKPVRTARLTDLRGEAMEAKISIDGRTVALPLAPCQIATVELGF